MAKQSFVLQSRINNFLTNCYESYHKESYEFNLCLCIFVLICFCCLTISLNDEALICLDNPMCL